MGDGTDNSERATWLPAAFAVILAVRTVGGALAPALFAFAPIVLLVASPFVPNLVLAAPEVPPVIFFATAVVVAIPHCVVAYAFGVQYGPSASEWIVRKTPVSESQFERLLGAMRYSAPIVLMALPGPLSSSLAGIAGVGRRLYGAVMVPTQIGWFVACFYLGESLIHAIREVKVFVIDHVLVLTLVTLLLVALRWIPSRANQ